MESLRIFLQQEFRRRAERNPRYSLRAFAAFLDVDHATLSSMLSGKRKITRRSAQKVLRNLNLAPAEAGSLMNTSAAAGESASTPYFLVQQDAFAFMSEWYFDAILELVDVVGGRLYPDVMAERLGISSVQANVARDTLVRLGLLARKPDGRFERRDQDTTTILDADSSNGAMRKHQKALVEKSAAAIDDVPKAERDHTSLCLAFSREDLPEARALIAEFRRKFNRKLGRNRRADSVYQLQVSLFPLSKPKGNQR